MFMMVTQSYINPFGNPFCCCCSPGMSFLMGLVNGLSSGMYFNNMSYASPAMNYSYMPTAYYNYCMPSVSSYPAYTTCNASNPYSSNYTYSYSNYSSTPLFSYTTSSKGSSTSSMALAPSIPTFGGGSYSTEGSTPAGSTTINPSSSSSSAAAVPEYNHNALPDIKNSSLMKNVPQERKERILAAVEKACKQYNIDPKLVIAMMYAESGFNPNATSPCGAAGLMQLMPGTAKSYGATDAYNIEQNINAAVKFIKYLKDRYNGNMDLMVAAYNAGPGRVKTSVPAIKETQNYVAKVKRTYSSLC